MRNKTQTTPHVNKSREKALKEYRRLIQSQAAEIEDEFERAKHIFLAEACVTLGSDDFMRVCAEVYGWTSTPKGGAQ